MSEKNNECKHMEFEAEVRTGRISKEEGGEIMYFIPSLKVWCKECKKRLVFKGIKNGYNSNEPTVSIDGFNVSLPAGIEGETASKLDEIELAVKFPNITMA